MNQINFSAEIKIQGKCLKIAMSNCKVLVISVTTKIHKAHKDFKSVWIIKGQQLSSNPTWNLFTVDEMTAADHVASKFVISIVLGQI